MKLSRPAGLMSNSAALKSILLLAANPKGTVSLRLQEEEREIKERLRLAGYGKVPINSTGATRTRDIQQAMLDFKPQIVHFTGHGSGKDGLAFEDGAGQLKLVDSEALANLFKLFSSRVECVVLNACYSQFQAEAIAQHINCVIGMSRAISDRAAIEFAVGFYTALGAGESIEFAYKLGCNAIQLEGISEYLTPVLFVKKNKLENVEHQRLDGDISPTKQEAKELPTTSEPLTAEEFYARGIGKYDPGDGRDPEVILGIYPRDYQRAIADFSEAIRLDPNHVKAYYSRMLARHKLGDKQGVIEDCSKVICLIPGFAPAYYYRGRARLEMDDYQGAITDLTESTCLKPDHAHSYFFRGRVKTALKDYQGAIVDYTEAIRLKPHCFKAHYLDYVHAYNGRGWMKYDLEDHQGAFADFSEAIRLQSNDPDLLD